MLALVPGSSSPCPAPKPPTRTRYQACFGALNPDEGTHPRRCSHTHTPKRVARCTPGRNAAKVRSLFLQAPVSVRSFFSGLAYSLYSAVDIPLCPHPLFLALSLSIAVPCLIHVVSPFLSFFFPSAIVDHLGCLVIYQPHPQPSRREGQLLDQTSRKHALQLQYRGPGFAHHFTCTAHPQQPSSPALSDASLRTAIFPKRQPASFARPRAILLLQLTQHLE